MSSLKSYHSENLLVQYTSDLSLRETDVQKRLVDATLELPSGVWLSAPEVLQLNANIMRAIGAKKVLDIGVFTGASSLSAALAIPDDGEVHGLDFSVEYTNIAKKFWEEAGVSHKIHLYIGRAKETLKKFIDEGQAGTFDFAFVDAEKTGYSGYYEQCLTLVRSGGIIAFDNTLMDGKVIDPLDQSDGVVAVRVFNQSLKDDQRVHLSFLNSGDGLTLCFKK